MVNGRMGDMKTKIITFFIMLGILFSFNINANAYKVSEYVRIGIKYANSAKTSADISSKKGFTFYTVSESPLEIATTDVKALTVDSSPNSLANSYFVIEHAGFGSLEDTLKYCEINSGATVPYYRNGVFYAIREGLLTYNDALFAQNQAIGVNASAYIIEPSANRLKVCDSSTGKCILIFSQDDGFLGISGRDGEFVSFGKDENYRGIMEFRKVNNNINIINYISMQEYLYSVVTAEIGATAPIEAQKAQAICARTYTEQNLNRHKSDGFNLCSTTHCQAYIGTKWEREQATKAVDETDKLIMTYGGKPISAVYFAHSGGYTANVEDVWGNPYPYLKSVEDKYCNDHTWEYTIDYDKITNQMNQKGYDLGEVYDIKIASSNEHGLVKKLVITGTKGSKTFERESARTILGLKSQTFTIPSDDLAYLVKREKGSKVENLYTILTDKGIMTIGDSVTIKNGNGKITELKKLSGKVIYGSGNGHHVGMSQCGAMGYAKEGWTYDEILKHYYKGVTIEGAE